jgi:hypothetical protein
MVDGGGEHSCYTPSHCEAKEENGADCEVGGLIEYIWRI